MVTNRGEGKGSKNLGGEGGEHTSAMEGKLPPQFKDGIVRIRKRTKRGKETQTRSLAHSQSPNLIWKRPVLGIVGFLQLCLTPSAGKSDRRTMNSRRSMISTVSTGEKKHKIGSTKGS